MIRSVRRFAAAFAAGTLAVFFCIFESCDDTARPSLVVYQYIAPDYNLQSIAVTNDTVHFPLDERTYNNIKTANVFNVHEDDFISFYDQRSGTANVYAWRTRRLLKKIVLKDFLKSKKLYKTTCFIKNWDSIFITNGTSLYLFDSAGIQKKKSKFLMPESYVWTGFEMDNLPVLIGPKLFSIVRPTVSSNSKNALRKWKMLYEFDLEKGRVSLHYHLPAMYQSHLFGYHYLDYNFCYNGRHFVFSLPADTVIYETNLGDFHKSYYAKSRSQEITIKPLPVQALQRDQGLKQYMTQGSYGPVYYDPYRKYYLRIAKGRISEADFNAKTGRRKQTIVILDSSFKIIGETEIDDRISYKSLFFSPGGIYARVDARDEYALHFVRMEYGRSTMHPDLSKK